MSTKVTVIDYGSGNLHSVIKALREVGAEVHVTSEVVGVREAERLILPGVGAFEDGMRGMRNRGLAEAAHAFFETGRPFLGICLGMQMLLSVSVEFGLHDGLGIIPGMVQAVPWQPGHKVPHMGWSEAHPPVEGRWTGTIFEETPPGTRFYFVHSFSASPANDDHRLADTHYGGFRISAAVNLGPVYGCQFHPEKSGQEGIKLLRKFVEI
ncbi:MAG: imidazole glycerol phosphate synthase subunit HisH [Roseimicrobium sp.]